MDDDKIYFWDFFGPRAEGTAKHFRKHLDDFLAENTLAGCETGLASEGAGHHAVYCRTPLPVQRSIEAALRPRRFSTPSG